MLENVTALRLHELLAQAGIQLTGVSIGALGKKGTYLVHPESVRAEAQPFVDAFDDSPEADDAWRKEQAAKGDVSSVQTGDQSSIVRAVLSVAFEQITQAQPLYVAPDIETAVAQVVAKLPSTKGLV